MRLTGLALPLVAATALMLTTSVPSADATTRIMVDNISATVADRDGFGAGDSDPYLKIFIDGVLMGTSTTINNNNHPIWAGEAFTLNTNPANPMVTITLEAWDEDGVTDDFLGTATIVYDWQAAAPLTATATLVYTEPGSITATIRVADLPVPVKRITWGRIKALMR